MKTYTITQEQMDRLHGAAHGGAMLGGQSAYEGCLKVGAILAEIAFKEGFDKSPGSAPECDYGTPYETPKAFRPRDIIEEDPEMRS